MKVQPIQEALYQLCSATKKWALHLRWDNLDFDSLAEFTEKSSLLNVFTKQEIMDIWLMDDVFILFDSQAEAEKVFFAINIEPEKISYAGLISAEGLVKSERL